MFASFTFLSCCFVASALPTGYAVAGWSRCAEKHSGWDTCIKNALNSIIPYLVHGGGDGIDPLFIERKDIDYSDGNMTLDLFLSDVIIEGLSSTHVQQVKSRTLENGKLELMCKTPAIIATGLYTSEGKAATFPLHSQGAFNITFSDLRTALVLNLGIPGEYLQVSLLKANVLPANIEVRAGSQLDGDNSLGAALNLYLNENSFELYDLLRPKLMSWLSGLVKDRANSILSQTPKADIFPNLRI